MATTTTDFKVSPICYNLTAVIANGAATSGAVDLKGTQLVGLFMPAAFTGTALSFTASTTLAGTYVAVKDTNGTTVSYTVGVDRYVPLSPSVFAGLEFIKLVSGSTEGAARTITLATRPL